MGCTNLKEVLAYAILSTSSAWSLVQCQDLKYARLAFGLYIANGSLGLVSNLMPKNNRKLVKTLLQTSSRIATALYMPLITAEACITSGLVPVGKPNEVFIGSLFVIPCTYLFCTEVLKKNLNRDILSASCFTNTITLLLSSSGNKYCVVTSLINCAVFLDSELSSLEHLILIAVANLTASLFFIHK